MGSKKNQPVYYLRPTASHNFKKEKFREVVLEAHIDKAAVEETLEIIRKKPYISQTLMGRLLHHVWRELKVDYDDASALCWQALGWPSSASITKSCIVKEAQIKTTLEARKRHEKQMRQQEEEKGRKKLLSQTGVGYYGLMGAEFGRNYFFNENTACLHALEELLKGYNNEHIQAGVDHYPRKMGWEEYHLAFGQFWHAVIQLNKAKGISFKEAGIESVKKLAHYLFTWNFRRYLDGVIVSRYARFLPPLYRHLHVAAHLDKNPEVLVDDEYPLFMDDDEEDEVLPHEKFNFDDCPHLVDEHEEPGDNRGNR